MEDAEPIVIELNQSDDIKKDQLKEPKNHFPSEKRRKVTPMVMPKMKRKLGTSISVETITESTEEKPPLTPFPFESSLEILVPKVESDVLNPSFTFTIYLFFYIFTNLYVSIYMY